MTQKEMSKLKRVELQDLVTEQNAVIEKLQFRVEELEAQLADRSMKIDEAGSLAEAAMQVSGVMEAAQNAAQQYLDNVKALSERQQAICAQQEEECKKKCHNYEVHTKQKCDNYEREVKQRCENLEKETEQKVTAYWTEFSQKVNQILDAHGALKEILKLAVPKAEEK